MFDFNPYAEVPKFSPPKKKSKLSMIGLKEWRDIMQAGNIPVIKAKIEEHLETMEALLKTQERLKVPLQERIKRPIVDQPVRSNTWSYGNPLLGLAAEYNLIEIMKYLVEQKKANVNACSTSQWSALNAALQYNHYEAALYLVSKNADVTVDESKALSQTCCLRKNKVNSEARELLIGALLEAGAQVLPDLFKEGFHLFSAKQLMALQEAIVQENPETLIIINNQIRIKDLLSEWELESSSSMSIEYSF